MIKFPNNGKQLISRLFTKKTITVNSKCNANCNNYRRKSVISTLSKLYGRILRDLIEKEYYKHEEEKQSEFRVGRFITCNAFYL